MTTGASLSFTPSSCQPAHRLAQSAAARSDTLPAMAEFVHLQVDDGVATLRLDRPPMNALNVMVQEEIRAAATEASERDEVRAVIIYGGEKVFAAGAAIKEMAE